MLVSQWRRNHGGAVGWRPRENFRGYVVVTGRAQARRRAVPTHAQLATRTYTYVRTLPIDAILPRLARVS